MKKPTIDERFEQLEKKRQLENKEVLSLEEVKLYTGLSLSTLYKLTSSGILPHSKPSGKRIFVETARLKKWLLSKPSTDNKEIQAAAINHVALKKKSKRTIALMLCILFSYSSNGQFMIGEAAIIMASQIAPPITPGYSFFYDAHNTASYPGTGTTLFDLSPNHNDITLHNSPLYDPSDGQGCLIFNGTNQYGQYSYTSDFDFSGGNYCIEGWFKFSLFTSQMVTSKDEYGTYFDWCIYLPDNTHIANYTASTGANYTATVTPMITNTWYYISIVGLSGMCYIYLNNVLQGSGTLSITNYNLTAGTIGGAGYNAPNTFMHGKIGQLRGYKISLSSSDISNNWLASRQRYGYP